MAKAVPPRQSDEGRRALGTRPAPTPGSTVFDDIAVAHREIYALYQIAQTMGTKLTVADTMTLVSSKLSSLVPFSACALFLYSPSREQLQCRFATGIDSELIQQLTLRSGQGLSGWVARNRRPLVNARPSTDLEAMGSKAPTVLQSALVCPLVFNDRLIGTLGVYHTEPSFYHEDHARLLDRVCEQAAAVINNAIVFEQTQEESLTDPLTGLPNTRSLFQHLARELARAERHKVEVSLLVMDLDDFKDINDTFGHRVGDWALREVARVLRSAIRPYDMCVRYAGDEFIVVLSGCGRGEAESKRVELQSAIGRILLDVEGGRRVPLSISAGMAVFPHDGDNYDALVAKADRQMYQDKSRRKQELARRVSPADPSRPGEPPPGDAPFFS
jgi:diguanylate cyclase (GGDEF)-like protein